MNSNIINISKGDSLQKSDLLKKMYHRYSKVELKSIYVHQNIMYELMKQFEKGGSGDTLQHKRIKELKNDE